ncbi:MAG: hypothetical protein SPE66_04050 [Bilifractor sp.]|nr:hypothetical protein [Bilifractor sp.]
MEIKGKRWRWILVIEFVVFFFGWTAILMAGADFPPPKGFYRLVILIAVLDIIQTLYLKWLAKRLIKGRTFLLNELFFCTAGTILAVIFILFNGGFRSESGIWVGIITAVSVGYGTIFWSINRLIAGVMKDRLL